MGICGNHCIELEYPESAPLALNKTVLHKLSADMIAAESLFHRKAGVADVSAPSHIVWVENIQTHHLLPVDVERHAAVALLPKKVCTSDFVQQFLLRKSPSQQCHWGRCVPNFNHFGKIFSYIASYFNLHKCSFKNNFILFSVSFLTCISGTLCTRTFQTADIFSYISPIKHSF